MPILIINKWLMEINLALSFFSVFIDADQPTLTLERKLGRSGDAKPTHLWASPKLFRSFPLKSLNIIGIFRNLLLFFYRISSLFANKLHRRWSTRFSKGLWLRLNLEVVVLRYFKNFKILICSLKIKAKLFKLTWDNVRFLVKLLIH